MNFITDVGTREYQLTSETWPGHVTSGHLIIYSVYCTPICSRVSTLVFSVLEPIVVLLVYVQLRFTTPPPSKVAWGWRFVASKCRWGLSPSRNFRGTYVILMSCTTKTFQTCCSLMNFGCQRAPKSVVFLINRIFFKSYSEEKNCLRR